MNMQAGKHAMQALALPQHIFARKSRLRHGGQGGLQVCAVSPRQRGERVGVFCQRWNNRNRQA
ncbi:hypothetical protein [Janthinobacterium sp. P210006]|uniref:hypothetical protein n=1 Tax=Janthinobacterium sp. P210006 TaxID=3112939 RepID=UPI002E25E1DC|nr:hypothetical protein [Janthinobacterium sp. P210006]